MQKMIQIEIDVPDNAAARAALLDPHLYELIHAAVGGFISSREALDPGRINGVTIACVDQSTVPAPSGTRQCDDCKRWLDIDRFLLRDPRCRQCTECSGYADQFG